MFFEIHLLDLELLVWNKDIKYMNLHPQNADLYIGSKNHKFINAIETDLKQTFPLILNFHKIIVKDLLKDKMIYLKDKESDKQEILIDLIIYGKSDKDLTSNIEEYFSDMNKDLYFNKLNIKFSEIS